MKYQIQTETTSIWTYVNDNKDMFTNPFYKEDNSSNIIPSAHYAKMQFWEEFFLKYTELDDYYASS